jgi:hypothetical protein
MEKSEEKDTATAEELLASSLARGEALAKLLIERGITTEEEISRKILAEKAKYQTLSQPKTSITLRFTEKIAAWSTGVVAVATVALAILTSYYAYLTDKLVQLQIEPSIETALDQPVTGSTTLVLRNTGIEPIEDVVANIRCVLYRHQNDPQPMVVFTGVPGDSKRSWWRIGTLEAGQIEKKDSIEAQAMCLMNKDSAEAFEREKITRQAKESALLPVNYGAIVIFDINYHRKIDLKQYELHRPFWLHKDGKTGKPVLSAPIVSSDFKTFLEELTSGAVKSK